MEKTARLLAAALLTSLLVAPASPAEDRRLYLGGQAGMFLPIESAVTLEPSGLQGKLTYNPGIVLAAALGYEFGDGIRGEAEFNYRQLTADKLHRDGTAARVDAGIRSCGVMANAYYDFRNRTAVTPFVGAGLGFAVAEFGRGSSGGSTLWRQGEDLSLAYQGIAGFSIALQRDISLDFVYRHYGTPSLHFDTLHSQYKGLNLATGVRYRF